MLHMMASGSPLPIEWNGDLVERSSAHALRDFERATKAPQEGRKKRHVIPLFPNADLSIGLCAGLSDRSLVVSLLYPYHAQLEDGGSLSLTLPCHFCSKMFRCSRVLLNAVR